MRVSVSLSDRIPEHAPWEDEAACRRVDPELFWAADGDHWTVKRAKAVCAQCPVVEQCLETALSNGHIEGVWGGKTPNERHRMTRRPPKRHGVAMYDRWGCRCEICRAAHNEKSRRWRAQRKAAAS